MSGYWRRRGWRWSIELGVDGVRGVRGCEAAGRGFGLRVF